MFRSLDKFQRVQPKRLSDKAVVRIVKRRAAAVGLDPARYAGHSLRAGLATSAAAGGASERAIMNQTGHRSTEHGAALHLSWSIAIRSARDAVATLVRVITCGGDCLRQKRHAVQFSSRRRDLPRRSCPVANGC